MAYGSHYLSKTEAFGARRAFHSLTTIKKAQRHVVAAGAAAVSLVACHLLLAALFMNATKDFTR